MGKFENVSLRKVHKMVCLKKRKDTNKYQNTGSSLKRKVQEYCIKLFVFITNAPVCTQVPSPKSFNMLFSAVC